MNDALRMNNHLDALHLDAEKPMRLDHLQAFVEQRRRIDWDLRSHVPGWMSHRLLWCDRVETFSRRFPQRSARCGQDDSPHGIRNAERRTPNVQSRILCIGR